jgi:acetyl esterase/lipase
MRFRSSCLPPPRRCTAEVSLRAPRIASSRKCALLALLLVLPALIGCGGSSSDDNLAGTPIVKWGEPEHGPPKGVVILLHGGGWRSSRAGFEQEMPFAKTLQARGYATVVIGYSSGIRGFREIEDTYAQVQRRYAGLPICAHGISAGGHLALMLATREPDLDCVVDLVGPADLTTLADQGGAEVQQLAVNAFGKDGLARWSPIAYTRRIKAKVLMVMAQTDPVVPAEQGPEFAKAFPSVKLVMIPPGSVSVWWMHGATVPPGSEEGVVKRQEAFIAQAISQAASRGRTR